MQLTHEGHKLMTPMSHRRFDRNRVKKKESEIRRAEQRRRVERRRLYPLSDGHYRNVLGVGVACVPLTNREAS
jgi:hypothetical protein